MLFCVDRADQGERRRVEIGREAAFAADIGLLAIATGAVRRLVGQISGQIRPAVQSMPSGCGRPTGAQRVDAEDTRRSGADAGGSLVP